MKAKPVFPLVLVAATALLFPSCVDSKVPLSDPQKVKPDDRLTGVWRFRGDGGEMTYYHVGRAEEKLPASVIRVISVQHMPDGRMQQGELLVFPTTLGGKTYLNVAEIKPSQLKLLEEKGWTADAVNAYLILRYQVTGDVLTFHLMDGETKRKAIEAGKIKGVIEKDQDGNTRAYFNDTSQNLGKFVAQAGDTLFSKDVLRLERVK
jgi:hypothetical protein